MAEKVLDRKYSDPIRPEASHLGMYSLDPDESSSTPDAPEKVYPSVRTLYTKIAKYLQELPDTISSILNNPEVDEWLKLDAIGQIGILPENERSRIILSILNNPEESERLKLAAIGRIGILPENERSKLTLIATPLLLSSPLHQSTHPEKFTKFKKSGSTTMIHPGDSEASTRIITVSSFLKWLKAYTMAYQWREAGFDYVPVEPIANFSESPENPIEVQVTTHNLRGRALPESALVLYSQQIRDEVTSDVKRIIDILIRAGIDHGHPHERNFVLVPILDQEGKIDLNRSPRIYIIDFDEAISTP